MNPLVIQHIPAFEPTILLSGERIHRQLRPSMPLDYASFLRKIFDEGGEFVVAMSKAEVVGLALFRCYTTTRCGKRFYVDDIVTDDALRARGVGSALLRALERIATARGAAAIELESGSERQRAHRFYLREGFEQFAVSFRKEL